MRIILDEIPPETQTMELVDLCAYEFEQQRVNGTVNEHYYLSLFQNAINAQKDESWTQLQLCFSETVRRWLRGHPSRDVAMLRDSEENYVALTFSRFWYAVHDQHIEFTTLAAALTYLRASLNGIIMDTLRFQLRQRTKEVSFPQLDYAEEPYCEDTIDDQHVWNSIQSLLTDERERRLAYLLYHCGLKPRDIVVHCAAEFDDIKEIYRLNRNLVERLRRSRDRLNHLLEI